MRVRRSVLAALTAGAVGVGSLVGGGVLPSVLPAGAAQAGGGLVAAYSFDDGRATDVSGLGNNGTVVNASPVTGKFGNALSFNGSSSIVRIPDSASVDLTKAMTLEAWVRPSAVGGWQTIAMKENAGDLAYGLYANSDSDGSTGLYVRGAGNTQRLNQSTSTRLAANSWTHVVATYDGTTMRIYRNGNLRVSKTVAISADVASGQLAIGGNSVWGEYFNGAIDNVRIYNRALSGAEVLANRDAAVVGGAGVVTQPTVTTAPAPAPTTTAPATTTTTKPVVTTTTVPATTTTTAPPVTGTCPAGTTRMPARVAEPQFVNWPNSSNTGVPAGTCLKASGTITVTQAGAVLDGLDVAGCIYVRADNVTIRRTRVTSTGCTWTVQNHARNLLLENVEIDGADRDGWCLAWGSYTARRVNIHGCQDGANLTQDPTIEYSFIHNLWVAPSAHNDGVQTSGEPQGISNIVLRGNNIHVPEANTSAIKLGAESGPVSGVLIDGNRLAGGGWTLTAGYEPGKGIVQNVSVINNSFGTAVYGPVGFAGPNVVRWENNVMEATGLPVLP